MRDKLPLEPIPGRPRLGEVPPVGAPSVGSHMRRLRPLPTTRKLAVRLSWLQASRVGAHDPDRKRLYEFTVGA